MRRFHEQPITNGDGTFQATVQDLSQEGWPVVSSLDGLASMQIARGKSQQLRLECEREAVDRGESIEKT
jgi:hypothetical protein